MNDPTPAQNRTESDERPESGLPAVQGAREARYAEAMRRSPNGPWMTLPGPADIALSFVRAVLPLVDAEVAAAVSEAQAEVARLRTDKATFEQWRDSWIIDMDTRLAQLAREEDRAESAEAEVERLREGIRALADEWDRGDGPVMQKRHCAADLRALLSPSPAATTGEACADCGHIHTPDGCTGPPTPSDRWAGVSVDGCDCDFDRATVPPICPVTGKPLQYSFDHGALVCTSCGSLAHARPAPVSSGEAALCDGCNVREPFEHRCHGEPCACEDCREERRLFDPAPVSSGEAAPGHVCSDACVIPKKGGYTGGRPASEMNPPAKLPSESIRPRPAPVVTPSAEGSE